MAKIGNCNDCGLYQHKVFKCADALLGPEKLALPTGQNWLVLTIYFVPASNCLLAV